MVIFLNFFSLVILCYEMYFEKYFQFKYILAHFILMLIAPMNGMQPPVWSQT